MKAKINRILKKMDKLNINREQKIDIKNIINFEKYFNIKFPETYVLYLTEIQNGGYSEKLHDKGPYYGIYSLEKSIEENKKWEVNICENFELTDDLEIEGNEFLIEKYQNTDTLNGTIPICEYGCGDFFRLIINGKRRGEIVIDSGTLEGVGYYFMNVDILTFFENWLDHKIKYGNKFIKANYSFLEFGNNIKYKIVE